MPRYSRPGAADTSATATNRRVNPAAKKSSEVNVVNIPGSMLMGLTKSKVVTSQTAAMQETTYRTQQVTKVSQKKLLARQDLNH